MGSSDYCKLKSVSSCYNWSVLYGSNHKVIKHAQNWTFCLHIATLVSSRPDYRASRSTQNITKINLTRDDDRCLKTISHCFVS